MDRRGIGVDPFIHDDAIGERIDFCQGQGSVGEHIFYCLMPVKQGLFQLQGEDNKGLILVDGYAEFGKAFSFLIFKPPYRA